MHRIHNMMFFENYYAFFSWYAHPVRVPIGLKSTLIRHAYSPVYRTLNRKCCGRYAANQRCPAHVQYLKDPLLCLTRLKNCEFFVKFLVLQDNRFSVNALYQHVRSEWIREKSLLPRNITLLLWIGDINEKNKVDVRRPHPARVNAHKFCMGGQRSRSPQARTPQSWAQPTRPPSA